MKKNIKSLRLFSNEVLFHFFLEKNMENKVFHFFLEKNMENKVYF
jgi:hypothetical protein